MAQLKTLFLVDDDEDDRFLIRDAVESIIDNLNIIEFDNGIDFLENIRQRDITLGSVLVLLDINMPRLGGLEVISSLRSDPGNKTLPILAISTASNPELIKEIYNTGANGYFTKPDSLQGINQLAKDIKHYLMEDPSKPLV